MKEKKPLNIQIGGRIKMAREAAGFTQEWFAEKIDVSVQYISDLERGVTGTSIPTLIKICEALRISSDFLLFGKTSSQDLWDVKMNQYDNLTSKQIEILTKGIHLIVEAFNTQD